MIKMVTKQNIIQDCLQSNRRKLYISMRKQRMLKRDIWEYLHEQGYFPCYYSVCHYIYAHFHLFSFITLRKIQLISVKGRI